MNTRSGLRLGVDIGGTFTDFALVDRDGARVAVHKQLTTPRDPSQAVLDGTAAICAEAGARPADLAEIVHGTTLVTNALIERRGDRTGMLVTAGFRDLFDIGREGRYDLFDLRLRYAEPLVERALRAEIPERLRHDGTVIEPLDEEAVARAVTRLVREEGIEALAICFLHAHASARHEARAREIARELHPGLHVSHSADVFPYPREYERWSTTVANSYCQPLVHRYLSRLEAGLAEAGFAGRLRVMGSSGGLMSLDTARRFPVRLLESGPAAGVLMAARIGRERNATERVLSFDLGGTTAKGALVRGGRPFRAYSFEAAHAYEYRSGSGLPLQIPVLDMTEIGTGGGSHAALDELGRLRVGPRSAGSEPGPVCYGRGGAVPTLTDANLVLGYLDPDSFLGGTMRLDRRAAERALAALGARLGVDALRAAAGVHAVANEDIARAFRMHATERGFDYRGSEMVAFGGGGPLHAARIARKLRVSRVVFPTGAGVMSAFGMLSGAPSFEAVRAFPRALAAVTVELFGAVLAALDREAATPLREGGLPEAAIGWDRRADMRYRGQGYDIEVPLPADLPPGDVLSGLGARFAERYREIFGATLEEPVEIVGLKVEARGPEPARLATAGSAVRAGDAPAGTRPAFFPALGGLVACPVHRRASLAPGTVLHGPALVEEAESTVLLDAGDRAEVAPDGALVATIGNA